MIGYLVFKIFGALLFVSSAVGVNLSASRLNVTLPTPMRLMTPYYDGKSDFIYFFGGASGAYYLDSILRFDISTETFEQIGALPETSADCPLEADSAGNLVYFDCNNLLFKIYKFDIANNSIKVVAPANYAVSYSASTKNAAGRVLILGGPLEAEIWEYDIDSDVVTFETVGRLPEHFSSATGIKVAENTVLIFGSNRDVPYLEFDVETLETKDVALNSFPGFQYGMTVTTDNKYVYVFGGHFIDAGIPTDGMIQLDPITHSWNFLQIDNFPGLPDAYFAYAPEVIWVEKLNRIYMFGGGLQKGPEDTFLDDIYYIDLNPSSPTTLSPTSTTIEPPSSTTLNPVLFTCDDRIDGTHPHPSDCSKYISCRNGTLQAVHPCPPPLLYENVSGNCNLPSLVNCELSCENKDDGTYPHPYECNLFIICSNQELFVFWCDPPLLFDPKELRCTLADLVQCEN